MRHTRNPECESLLDVEVDQATHSVGLYPLLGGEPDLGAPLPCIRQTEPPTIA
jgi:hypothetical protein